MTPNKKRTGETYVECYLAFCCLEPGGREEGETRVFILLCIIDVQEETQQVIREP